MRYLLAFLFLVSCAPKPTKVTSETPVVSRKEVQKAKVTANTVILDVRAPMDFNLSHIPGSVNVAWEDFSRRAPDYRGLIEKDLHPIARRLALIGIDPQTPVLIVGKGQLGKGEEGRVAWTLESLGITNIQLANVEDFRERREGGAEIKNKNFWTPQLNQDLAIGWDELKSKIEGTSYFPTRARTKALSGAPLPIKDLNFVVIDVRSPEEYSIDNLNKRTPRQFRFYNIDWREFFTENMDPNPAVMKMLNEKGITEMTEIDLISNHGVRSGSVTWALQRLGYKKARNFSGGYEAVRFSTDKKADKKKK
ncbi:MAG: ABC transporter ATP-binding protein [Bdellovibrionales bacterium]|nr:ABC transporter ATP-binding protein [Bdellovibrionales bacterium]